MQNRSQNLWFQVSKQINRTNIFALIHIHELIIHIKYSLMLTHKVEQTENTTEWGKSTWILPI